MLQAIINSNPPIGVTNPIILKLKDVKLLVASKYIEPENRIIPKVVKINIVFLILADKCVFNPKKSKNKA